MKIYQYKDEKDGSTRTCVDGEGGIYFTHQEYGIHPQADNLDIKGWRIWSCDYPFRALWRAFKFIFFEKGGESYEHK